MEEKRGSSANEVMRHVVEMVVSGEVLPRQVLYETTLATDVGLSRTPVREALSRLVGEGFLEQTRGKRGYAVPPLTPEDMRNVYYARECLEQKLAFLAAEKAVKSDVELLERINAEELAGFSGQSGGGRSAYTRKNEPYSAEDLNVRFHMSVAAIACNKYLERIYEITYWRSHLYTHYVIGRLPFPPEVEAVFERRKRENLGAKEHRELIGAIASRDGERAARLTLAHLCNTTYYAVAFKHPEILFALSDRSSPNAPPGHTFP